MIDIKLDIDANRSNGEFKQISMDSSDDFFSMADSFDKNIFVSDEKGIFRILEHKMELSSKNPREATDNYYLNRARVYKKQLLVTLGKKYLETYGDSYTNPPDPRSPKINSVCINAKDLMFMDGNIDTRANIKGMGDLIGKTLQGSVTKEGMIKPEYSGDGYLMLEPTFKYIILHDLSSSGGDPDRESGIIISDGSYLASSGNVKLRAVPVSTISSAAFGKEGVFNLSLKGKGVIAYTSPVPKNDITVVELKGSDELKVNGNYAIAWSDSLVFTVEPISNNLLGNAVSSEGFMNVYKGKGKVWLSSVLP